MAMMFELPEDERMTEADLRDRIVVRNPSPEYKLPKIIENSIEIKKREIHDINTPVNLNKSSKFDDMPMGTQKRDFDMESLASNDVEKLEKNFFETKQIYNSSTRSIESLFRGLDNTVDSSDAYPTESRKLVSSGQNESSEIEKHNQKRTPEPQEVGQVLGERRDKFERFVATPDPKMQKHNKDIDSEEKEFADWSQYGSRTNNLLRQKKARYLNFEKMAKEREVMKDPIKRLEAFHSVSEKLSRRSKVLESFEEMTRKKRESKLAAPYPKISTVFEWDIHPKEVAQKLLV
jgi:hypothetical protein